jgi:hypothetical protein
MFAWLMLGWGAAVLLVPAPDRTPRLVPALGLAAVAAIAVVVSVNPRPDDRERAYDALQTIRTRLDTHLGDTRRVTVIPTFERCGALLYDTYSSVVYMLRAQGRVVRSPDPSVQNTFGDWYFNERRTEPEVLIGDKQLPPDASRWRACHPSR